MTDKKIILVAQSMAIEASDRLKEIDAWGDYDMVIVPDSNYVDACETARKSLPEGKRMRDVGLKDLTNSIEIL